MHSLNGYFAFKQEHYASILSLVSCIVQQRNKNKSLKNELDLICKKTCKIRLGTCYSGEMARTDLSKQIGVFREILLAVGEQVQAFNSSVSSGSYWLDWLQANWESVVEAAIASERNIFLEVYGEGADCNGASSRVCFPSALATHQIVCIPKGKAALDVMSGLE